MIRIKVLVFAILLFNLTHSFSQSTLGNGLRAHYRFNGNLLDETPYQHHLQVILGTDSYTNVAPNDLALSLNGSTTVTTMNVFNNSDWTQMAIAFWFKVPQATDDLQVMLQGAYIGFGIYVEPNSGKVMGFFDGSSADSYTSTMPLTDNAWHHIVIQTDGVFTAMYIDGEYDGGRSENIYVGNGSANNKLFMGRSNFNTHNFTGELNEMRIYNRTLKVSEIRELAEAPYASINEDMPNDYIFTVFPNPVNNGGNLTLDLAGVTHQVKITMSDNAGRIIFDAAFHNQNQVLIPITGLAAGMYSLSIYTGDFVETKKIIVR